MNFEISVARPHDRKAMLDVLEPWNMHHIPSLEMEEIDFNAYFVAKVAGKIVGVSGFKHLYGTQGKTTLLAVYPEFQGGGIGKALQDVRLDAMYRLGIKSVLTNADRADTILWYKKHYGYKEVGRVKKVASFGLDAIEHWTTLELNLEQFMGEKEAKKSYQKNLSLQYDPHPLNPFTPLIINVAPTGMVPTKRSNPYVPISSDEIIEEAIRLAHEGASLVHLHARDANGKPTSSAKAYETIILGIRKACPHLICCVSTSGRGGVSLQERCEVLYLKGDAKPDMASLTLGSMNFLSGPSINSLETVQELALCMKEQGIKPEVEIFDSGMISLAKYLQKHELLPENNYFNLLLGNLNTAQATLADLTHLYSVLPRHSIWAGTGLGIFQLPMNIASMIAGGHVRLGLEDALYMDATKETFATNVSLLERIKTISLTLGRSIATPEEARLALGLPLNVMSRSTY